MEYKIKDIIEICNGKLLTGDTETICESFSIDTRTIDKGDIYIGIKGDTLNGNLYYEDAIKKGAYACILDEDSKIDLDLCQNITIVLVEDTVLALQILAKHKRNQYNIPVIAVTGSVGKTSTKDMISTLLESKYKVLKTAGNFNNHIGLPLTILRLKDHNCMVLEMGMNHFDEIRVLTNIAKPTIGVITNIGTAHIGILGSRENILKAKLELLEGMEENSVLVVNNDIDLLQNLNIKQKIITIGIENNSDYMAVNIKEEAFSNAFDINSHHITIPIGGRAFVYNALMAYAINDYLQVPMITKNFEKVKISPHRLEKKITKDGIIIIDDTYNANLDSVRNALELLGKASNRKVAFLGDMMELDNYEEEIHRKVGEIVVANNIDILITVGKRAKYISEEALSKGFNKNNIYSYDSIYDTFSLLEKILKIEDIILLKASHSMEFNKVVEYLMK